jgi:DNA-binding protein H-NS
MKAPSPNPAIDLSDYTLAEIRGLLFEIADEIRKREREQVAAARERALEIAKSAGLAPDALLAPDGATAKPRTRPRRR